MDRIRRMGVLTPGVYLIDQVQRKIYMEYLGDESMTVKAFLYQLGTFDHPSKSLMETLFCDTSLLTSLIFCCSFGVACRQDSDIIGNDAHG